MRGLVTLLLLLHACGAYAAPPVLDVPHAILGLGTAGAGPAAIWQTWGQEPFLIQTRFDLAAARGTVERHTLSAEPNALPGAGVLVWDAGARLTGAKDLAAQPPPAQRRLYTLASSSITIPFIWNSLSAPARAMLDVPTRDAAADGLGEARTGWLRGERQREAGQAGGVLRARTGLIGEVLHSTPLVVGPPMAQNSSAAYAAFRERAAARPMAVYVGANDGMLHAFDAADGNELFAYLPRALLPRLSALSGPGYLAQPYVDASPGQRDMQLKGRWRSVLACGLGMGGRGLFALDISDPGQFAAGMGALWEFTDADDEGMGHLRAAPALTLLATGLRGKGGVPRPVAVAASGINPRASDNNGVLFLLALDKPAAQEWKAGLNYVRIATSGADPDRPNALAPPTLVLRRDGTASHAYAGDLQGNLWRFDLTARKAYRLFTARDAEGASQPIAHAPQVVFAPGGGYLVVFGTGRLLEQADLAPPFSPQTLYAVHDRMAAIPEPIASRKQLARRTLTGSERYTVSGDPIDYAGPDAKRGWYVDFPEARSHGERAARSPVAAAGAVFLETLLFDPDGGPPGGRLYVFDVLTGMLPDIVGLAEPATGERIAAPLIAPVFTMSSSGPLPGEPAGTAVRTVTILRPHAGAQGGSRIRLRHAAGRLAWREIGNWAELNAAARKRP